MKKIYELILHFRRAYAYAYMPWPPSCKFIYGIIPWFHWILLSQTCRMFSIPVQFYFGHLIRAFYRFSVTFQCVWQLCVFQVKYYFPLWTHEFGRRTRRWLCDDDRAGGSRVKSLCWSSRVVSWVVNTINRYMFCFPSE